MDESEAMDGIDAEDEDESSDEDVDGCSHEEEEMDPEVPAKECIIIEHQKGKHSIKPVSSCVFNGRNLVVTSSVDN